jgi:hypothetical protein
MAMQGHTDIRPVPSAADSGFAHDVIAGLSARPKRLSPKYFYDEAGSQLFERITTLPEYYPTRSELAVLKDHAGDIAKLIPRDAAMIEFGSGSTRKARLLLAAAPTIAAYVPVDISAEMLSQEAAELRRDFPTCRCCRSRQILPSRSACQARFRRLRASASFPARRSAISNRTTPQRSCVMPARCWAAAPFS